MSMLPLIASALLPLVAQVGPFTPAGGRGTPIEQKVERPAKAPPVRAAAAAPLQLGSPRLIECLNAVDEDAEAAEDRAQKWSSQAKGADLAEADLCLGSAESRLDNWPEAERAFLAGRDASGSNRMLRARLGAMAGNAALAAQAPDRALAALEPARVDVKGLADPALAAGISIDRARALVALKRLGEAEAALSEARGEQPANAEAWLLSATLSRRAGRLAEAQQRIERAAELLPVDPDIGVEAGVIAILSGREAAARKSWESVVKMAPESPAATTAKAYLAQLASPPSGGGR